MKAVRARKVMSRRWYDAMMLLMGEMHRGRISWPSGNVVTTHGHTWHTSHRVSGVGNARAHGAGRRSITFVLAQTSFAPIDCTHSTRWSVSIVFRLAALARVVGPSFVHIGREDARKVLFELFCLCEIELLRLAVNRLPLC